MPRADVLRFPDPVTDPAPYDAVAAFRQLLVDTLAELDAGTIRPRCGVLMFVDETAVSEYFFPTVYQTGSSRAEQVAFLEIAKLGLLRKWQDA